MHETLALKAKYRRFFFRFSSGNGDWPEEVNTGGEKAATMQRGTTANPVGRSQPTPTRCIPAPVPDLSAVPTPSTPGPVMKSPPRRNPFLLALCLTALLGATQVRLEVSAFLCS